ncbi:MAG: MbcA/ParS/Xre antitoxin family protein [Sphingopyxis sp.]|nr:MbcA/ParS/Xre antitoxin family protein [Sphingopyxis sp.]MDP3781854.1 MbcA/ParS/Xre antitoxin family protein [Sphingopyxis sp.]|tara:strand:+ start:494 stop:904 length:411 start_codon:yes stop_codon:yes gene_type:complete
MQLVAIKGTVPPQAREFSTEEVQAMQRAVIRLFDHWGVTDAQAAVLLGDIAVRTYQRWKQGEYGRWNVDLAARLSNLIGIHKALRLLYTEADRGYRWIKAPNRAFGERTALEVMLGGQLTDLMRVRRYLDSYRSAW